jgi:hypothetical protein
MSRDKFATADRLTWGVPSAQVRPRLYAFVANIGGIVRGRLQGVSMAAHSAHPGGGRVAINPAYSAGPLALALPHGSADRAPTFPAHARSGRHHRADRSLGLSATVASRALRELEDDLALRLFDRTTRQLAPTEAGRRLAARITPLLEGLDAAMGEAREMHEEATGTLRIVARRSYAVRHLVPRLAGFRAAHPRVEIDLKLTEQTGLVPVHGVDLVIRLGLPAGESL